jgi:hypothetical protein
MMASPQLIDYHSLMTPDAIVIYPSRGKLLLLAAAAAGFVAIGIFMVASAKAEDHIRGIAVIVFFGLCLFVAAWQLVRRTPAVIIHYSGILYAAGRSAGFLRWEEISGVYIASMNVGRLKNHRFLAIVVKDLDAFLTRQSRLQAKLVKMSVSLIGAPVGISASTLPISLEELIQKIQQKCPGIPVTP